MDISKDLVEILFQLLPGFLAAGIFYTLTAHPKGSSFERIVQALIFTGVIRVVVACIEGLAIFLGATHWGSSQFHLSLGTWNSNTTLIWSYLFAVVVGVLMSRNVHSPSFVFKLMQRFSCSRRTASPSQWYTAFHKYQRYVVLTLEGERRLKGWPEEWPDECDKGHFIISDASWLLDSGETIPITQTSRMLVPTKIVSTVDFVFTDAEVFMNETETALLQQPLLKLYEAHDEGKINSGAGTLQATVGREQRSGTNEGSKVDDHTSTNGQATLTAGPTT